MKKRLCPACGTTALFVKNESGERRAVYVSDTHEITCKNEEESLEGFDLTIIYCFGCSWDGSVKRLK